MSDEKALVKREPLALELGYVEAEREHWKFLLGLAKAIFESGLAPKSHSTPQQTAIVMLTGRDYGFSPMQAMRLIDVVEGKARLESQGAVAIVRREKAGKFAYNEGEGFCEITGTRTESGETMTARWDRERVARSGINKSRTGEIKHNWKAHEKEMLRHRCEGEVCTALFSDLLGATYSSDEMDEIREQQEALPASTTSRTEAIKQALGLPPDQGIALANQMYREEVAREKAETALDDPDYLTRLNTLTEEQKKSLIRGDFSLEMPDEIVVESPGPDDNAGFIEPPIPEVTEPAQANAPITGEVPVEAAVDHVELIENGPLLTEAPGYEHVATYRPSEDKRRRIKLGKHQTKEHNWYCSEHGKLDRSTGEDCIHVLAVIKALQEKT